MEVKTVATVANVKNKGWIKMMIVNRTSMANRLKLTEIHNSHEKNNSLQRINKKTLKIALDPKF